MNLFWLLIGALIGITISVVVYLTFQKTNNDGVLHIDSSDVDGPYMFLVIKKEVGDISKRKTVTLKIECGDYAIVR